jgi:5-methyltetrahydropteroyltriglutamate--homocysteine methyltransferase
MAPKIKTTVVGSYPVPAWLAASPSEQALRDATRVVLHTQEQAGIDLVCDGEMYRFDVNHPETNGMIEYFVRPLGGIRTDIHFDELLDYRGQEGMGFRRRPPAVVDGPIHGGGLDLPGACEAAMALTDRPLKFTLTGPHMLAKTVVDRHYGDVRQVADAIADALAAQVRHCRAEVVQIDEANLPGHPDEWEWAAAAINKVLDAVPGLAAVHLCFGNYGGQSIQRGGWDKLLGYLNALHVDHIVMENAHRPVEELAAFKELRPKNRHGARRGGYQTHGYRERRCHRQTDRAGGRNTGRGPGEIHPSRLRLLDAAAQRGGRQNTRADGGPRPL